jgi:DNA methyltransferase 1-associated protein 1
MTKNERVTKWLWHPFNNPARKDGLKLSHWQRKEDVNKDYEYAQFNKKINMIEFTEEEYNRLLKVCGL